MLCSDVDHMTVASVADLSLCYVVMRIMTVASQWCRLVLMLCSDVDHMMTVDHMTEASVADLSLCYVVMWIT